MNIVVLLLLVVSLLTSTGISVKNFKIKQNKWLGIGVAFTVNTLILSLATIFLYKFDVQTFHKQADGSLGILVFAFFIPILTLINFYILEYLKHKRTITPR